MSGMDNNLIADGFLARTGEGHARGRPSAQTAAITAIPGIVHRRKEFDKAIRVFLKDDSQTLSAVDQASLLEWKSQKSTYDYIFLNFDESKPQ